MLLGTVDGMAGDGIGERRVDPSEPVDEIMASMRRLGRLLSSRQGSSQVTAAAGVEATQQGVALLWSLLRDGEQSVASLAAAASMDLGAVSRQVRLLEEAGAVARTRSPDDGRVALLSLTRSGRRTAERLRDTGTQHLADALAGWTLDEAQTLAALMHRLVDDILATPIRPPDRT